MAEVLTEGVGTEVDLISEAEQELELVRLEIDDIDRQIVELLARRMQLTDGLVNTKNKIGPGTRDATRENQVIQNWKDHARERGLDEGFAGEMAVETIGESSHRQSDIRVELMRATRLVRLEQ